MTIQVIKSATDALQYHKLWTSSIELGYHPKVKQTPSETPKNTQILELSM